MKKMRITALLLTAALCSSFALGTAAEEVKLAEPPAAVAEEENGFFQNLLHWIFAQEEFHDSGCLDMPKLSEQEIVQLLAENPTNTPNEVYESEPLCTAPYAAGKVKTEVLQAAANRLTALRRLAGLPAVELDLSLSENAQYGAVILARIGGLDHTPSNPGDMPDWFYREAYKATSSSNLAYRSGGLSGRRLDPINDALAKTGPARAVDDLMMDNFVLSVGHRRWQLNPSLKKVGFGYVADYVVSSAEDGMISERMSEYTVEKVFDTSGKAGNYNFIAWPASGNFPNSQQPGVWSISLNPEKFQQPIQSDVRITLTRESDGAVWKFGGSDGWLSVNTDGYGINNCIVFSPIGISDVPNSSKCIGTYTVRVDGLVSASGRTVKTFEYQVNFVDA